MDYNVELTCTYCGCHWNDYIPYRSAIGDLQCLLCGDHQITVRDIESTKIDYYAGSPPFPDKPPVSPIEEDKSNNIILEPYELENAEQEAWNRIFKPKKQ